MEETNSFTSEMKAKIYSSVYNYSFFFLQAFLMKVGGNRWSMIKTEFPVISGMEGWQ